MLIGAGLVLVLTIIILFSEYGIIKRISLESDKDELYDKIAYEKQAADSLKNEIKLLKYDSTEIERIAREKYGLMKKGEKIYYIKPKQ